MSTEKSQTQNQTLTFAVAAAAESPTETRVSVRDFEFVVDEPESLGGANAGPNPVEYVLGALAGCLNVTAHVVAREMDLDVRDLEIAIEGDLNPATFMGKREDGRAGYQEIRVAVTADVDADAETIDAWLAAVEARCPVSDNLRNATPLALSFDRRE
ncbi:OsmC family protein [Haloferax volcanii]|uniref:OsmC-like protein superfamily protein n=3 Tax=Haloferax volcanii TaxID=2246 RepID=M0I6V3_HALVO|nr:MULTISPECIES: OsmC family protein [Haloferax]ELK55502.1 OsmC-like protein superfamily protein [Haloferax sp. BAB-2207]ELZ71060.1 OsmC-like protein superfamily protein [Haloferax lucentense DSM 14919]ELZ92535.1 OsmC-like protein superfamily protein [Haloferax alexandrinus JCM 10717]WEL28686.1 Putative redox protein, regulator of disulfide bond formation [Haloferax alexandrinus]